MKTKSQMNLRQWWKWEEYHPKNLTYKCQMRGTKSEAMALVNETKSETSYLMEGKWK